MIFKSWPKLRDVYSPVVVGLYPPKQNKINYSNISNKFVTLIFLVKLVK
jgi:hypothetical protein